LGTRCAAMGTLGLQNVIEEGTWVTRVGGNFTKEA